MYNIPPVTVAEEVSSRVLCFPWHSAESISEDGHEVSGRDACCCSTDKSSSVRVTSMLL